MREIKLLFECAANKTCVAYKAAMFGGFHVLLFNLNAIFG